MQEPIIKDPTDNLILHTITAHAIRNGSGAKAFVSGNTKDFGSQDVKNFLSANGNIQYFAEVSNFLGWYNAGCPGSK
ncbi:hypothetical protein [Gloeobacter kilaueensis]|nr:hypothetical protein [Gloeobacter kilaueensis]